MSIPALVIGGGSILLGLIGIFVLLKRLRRLRAERRKADRKIAELEAEIADMPEDGESDE